MWDSQASDWLTSEQIQAKLPRRGTVTEKGRSRRIKVISHIPWDLRALPDRLHNAWLNEPGSMHFYHNQISERGELTSGYTLDRKKGMLTRDKGEFQLTHPGFKPARVIAWDAARRSFMKCNPEDDPVPPNGVWVQPGIHIDNLSWDPGEWVWRQTDKLKITPFFSYTARRGYLHGLRKKAERSIAVQELVNQGFSKAERSQVFLLLWHNSRPKKQATFLWQVLNRGVVTGDWLSYRIRNADVGCSFCSCSLESTGHLFYSCTLTLDLWCKFNNLAARAGVPQILSLQTALIGLYSTSVLGDTNKFVYSHQPWDLMRSFLVWFIWIERCSKRYGN